MSALKNSMRICSSSYSPMYMSLLIRANSRYLQSLSTADVNNSLHGIEMLITWLSTTILFSLLEVILREYQTVMITDAMLKLHSQKWPYSFTDISSLYPLTEEARYSTLVWETCSKKKKPSINVL